MEVIYKKNIIDKIIDEINISKKNLKKIDIIYLTLDEAQELIKHHNSTFRNEFYLRGYEIINSENNTEITFKHNLDFILKYRSINII